MKIILFTFDIFIVIDIRILPSFTQILMLNFLQCEKKPFSPLKPIVNIFITVIILTFFTNGKIILNSVQVLVRMPTMNEKDLGKI